MLDAKVIKTYDDLLEAKLLELDDGLHAEFNKVTFEMSRRGMLQSGAAILEIVRVAADALAIRADYAQLYADTCLKSSGTDLDEDTAAEFTKQIVDWITVQQERLTGIALQQPPFKSRIVSDGGEGPYLRQLEDRANQRKKAILAHFQLAVLANGAKKPAGGGGSGVTLNVSGDVGIIQVGDHNSASLDAGGIEALKEITNDLLTKLAEDPAENEELQDVLESIKAELASAKPNKTKLQGLFSSVVGTVKFIPALRGTWDVVTSVVSRVLGVLPM